VAVAWTSGVVRQVRAVEIPLAAIPPPGARRRRPVVADGATPAPGSGRGRRGEQAPDMELVALDGRPVSLASLRGRAVLLNLWATWCGPCIEEMSELAALHARLGGSGLVVVGVNVDGADAAEVVRGFVSQRKVPFPVWLDPEMRVPRALRVEGLPATFVIGRDGRILWRRNRAITATDPELQSAIGRALNSSTTKP
jgi:peroxiredoxin